MTHPSDQQWMDFLYDELPTKERAQLSAHLETCGDCRAQLAQWRAAQQGLDAWKLPVEHRSSWFFRRPAAPWAAAAAILLGCGLAIGWFAATRAANATIAGIRSSVVTQVREEVRREMNALADETTRAAMAGFEKKQAELRQQDRAETTALVQDSTRQARSEIAYLRRDLETVAVTAEVRLQQTAYRLGELAAVSQSTPSLQP